MNLKFIYSLSSYTGELRVKTINQSINAWILKKFWEFLQSFAACCQFLFLILPLSAETLKITGVRYLLPDSQGFSEISDIIVVGNQIVKIKPAARDNFLSGNLRPASIEKLQLIEAKVGDRRLANGRYLMKGAFAKGSSENKVRYVVPSFCDSFVTLGADSLGGMNESENIKLGLKSFIVHGFTDIQSVGDGQWIESLKNDLKKDKEGIDVFVAGKPLIPVSPETDALNKEIFYAIASEKEAVKTIKEESGKKWSNLYLFHRYKEQKDYPLNASVLFKMNKIVLESGKNLVASTYADRYSILESLSAGIRYLHHPIPLAYEAEFYKMYIPEIKWMPMLGVYYMQSRNEKELKAEIQFLNQSSFFKKNYFPKIENKIKNPLAGNELIVAREEYQSYIEFLKNHMQQKNNSLARKMILAGGSGYNYQFPGLAGIIEMRILFDAGIDGERIIRIASENTCRFIGADERKIKEGSKANILIFRDNPAAQIDNLFSLESVVKNGDLVVDTTTKVKHVTPKKNFKTKGKRNEGKKKK